MMQPKLDHTVDVLTAAVTISRLAQMSGMSQETLHGACLVIVDQFNDYEAEVKKHDV